VLDQPHTAVNSKVVFEAYFLAIGATCLRYDRRACVVAGVVAVGEYLAIVWIADTFWALNETELYAPFIYGAFNWSAQISRMILLLTASVLSFVVVTRTQELLRLSTRDHLTGLYNRGYLHERVAIEVNRARRTGQPLAIAMIDVDRFKFFNDTHGHAAGDRVIQAVAKQIAAAAGAEDLVCRYGGEEFCFVAPNLGVDETRALAEQIRQRVERDVTASLHDVPQLKVTVSVGVHTRGAGAATVAELIDRADQALYRSKRTGRNRVSMFAGPQATSLVL